MFIINQLLIIGCKNLPKKCLGSGSKAGETESKGGRGWAERP